MDLNCKIIKMAKIWKCFRFCLFDEKINYCCCKTPLNRFEFYTRIFGMFIGQYIILTSSGLLMSLLLAPNSNLLTGECNKKYMFCNNNQLDCSINNWSKFLFVCPLLGIPGDLLLIGLVILIYFLVKKEKFSIFSYVL